MLVSVITPTYNRSDTLPRAAQSVLDQTYDPIEYLIVDDGSTDDTAAVVEGFDDADLTYLELEENRGVSGARNAGVEAATGEYVLFVDADDELPPSAIATLVEEVKRTPERCAGAFGQQLRYTRTGEAKRATYDGEIVSYADLCDENYLNAFGGKLVRRRLFDEVGGIDPQFPSSEDFDFFLRVAAAGYHFTYVDGVVYYKHHHDDRLYGDTAEKVIGLERILEKHGNDLSPAHRASRNRAIGHTYAKRGRPDEAADRFRTCVKLCPTVPDYYLLALLAQLRFYNSVHALKSGLSRRL